MERPFFFGWVRIVVLQADRAMKMNWVGRAGEQVSRASRRDGKRECGRGSMLLVTCFLGNECYEEKRVKCRSNQLCPQTGLWV